ncbi:MAG: hypothetical protein M0Z63_03180 [Actinomycetota bacterium]|nr:hypothetical protein [Actinomycetota bacterium]
MALMAPPALDAEALIAEARAERRRRWRRNGLAVAGALVAVAAAVGGYEGLRSPPPAPEPQPFGSPTSTTWHLAGLTAWDGGGPPNFALAQQSSVSCAGASACYVEVQAYGYQPDGSPTVSGTVPGLSPFRTTAYRTGDGGRTWSRVPLPPATYLSSPISCTSASRCAVGARIGTTFSLDAPGSTAAVLTTADGGRSWQQHRLPSWVGLATSVACPTATRCVAVVEASTRAAIGGMAPWDGADRFYASDVLTTADRGRTWSTSPLPGRSGDQYLRLHTLACPTTQDCVVAGERAVIVSKSAAQYVIGATTGVVLSSVDGGRTFTSRTTPAVPLLASCPTPTSCLALARGSGPGSAVVLVGSVTGQWHTVAPTGFPAELAAAPSLTCPTAGHCLAIVGTDQVEVTADGGRTWRAGKIVAGTAASATGPPTASTVEPLSSACTASGRCLLLAARSPAAAVPPGPAQLQVLVNG